MIPRLPKLPDANSYPTSSTTPPLDSSRPCPFGSTRLPRPLAAADHEWLNALSAALSPPTPAAPHGTLFWRGSPGYNASVRLFSRAVLSPALAVVRPYDTEGVSLALKAAKRAGWSVSTKGGGFGTNGWAVHGDLVLDLCKLNAIEVHTPVGSNEAVPPPFARAEGGTGRAASAASDAGTGRRRTVAEAFERIWQPGPSPAEKNHSGGLVGKGEGPISTDSLPSGSGTNHDPSTDPSSGGGPNPAPGTGSISAVDHRDSKKQRKEDAHDDVQSWTADQERKREADAAAREEQLIGDGHAGLGIGKSVAARAHDGDLQRHFRPLVDQSLTGGSGTAAEGVHVGLGGGGIPQRLAPPSGPIMDASARPTVSSGSSDGMYLSSGWQPPAGVTWHSDNPLLASAPALPVVPDAATAGGPPSLGPDAALDSFEAFSTAFMREATFGVAPGPPALVTFGGGAKAKDIDAKTGAQGYHVPMSAFPVGSAIFSTGGFGFLSRLKGLAMDNVVAAELVLPSGRIVTLTEDYAPGSEEEELWWAFRGAGTTLGVITRMRCKAWKVGLVFGASLVYDFAPATAPSLIKHWRDCLKNAPPELYANLILSAGPDSNKSIVIIQLFYLGHVHEGQRFASAIQSWEGGKPIFEDTGMCTFLQQRDQTVRALDSSSPHSGNRWCIRSDLINSLPDLTVHDTVRQFAAIPERSAWIFEIAGQAVADVDPSTSCFPLSNRKAPFNVAAIHQWREETEDSAWVAAAKAWIDSTISPHSSGGPYPCFLENRTDEHRIKGTFGGDGEGWEKLKKIKARVDPDGLLPYTLWPSSKA